MNYFSALSLVFAAILPAPPAAAAARDPARERAVTEAIQRLPMRFERAPLGNVARLLSARFSVPISIAANAKAPVTADLSKLELKAALDECARQAGLTVVALGKVPLDGFSLEPARPPVPENGGDAASANASPEGGGDQAALAASAARRAELLRQRKALHDQEIQASNGVSEPR